MLNVAIFTRTYLRIPRVRDGVHLGAVLDGDRRRVLYVHKASDGDEMRPNGPVPSGRRQDGARNEWSLHAC